jgi:hypothetical protein
MLLSPSFWLNVSVLGVLSLLPLLSRGDQVLDRIQEPFLLRLRELAHPYERIVRAACGDVRPHRGRLGPEQIAQPNPKHFCQSGDMVWADGHRPSFPAGVSLLGHPKPRSDLRLRKPKAETCRNQPLAKI